MSFWRVKLKTMDVRRVENQQFCIIANSIGSVSARLAEVEEEGQEIVTLTIHEAVLHRIEWQQLLDFE